MKKKRRLEWPELECNNSSKNRKWKIQKGSTHLDMKKIGALHRNTIPFFSSVSLELVSLHTEVVIFYSRKINYSILYSFRYLKTHEKS